MLTLVEVDTSPVTSAKDREPERNFDIYPVPVVNGAFTIDNAGDITQVEVFTLLGSRIASSQNSVRSTSLRVSVNPAEGMLLIKLHDRHGRMFYKKLFAQ